MTDAATHPPAPTDLLDLARRLATRASDHLLVAVHQAHHESSTKTSATDLVTETDRAVERLIVEGLREARPHDGIHGEEGARTEGSSGVHWFVDPIDGTTNFWYGLPGFNVSIAAAVDDTVVAGVVVDVMRGEVFTATAGGGAHVNGRAIHCTDRADLSLALVTTGFSYEAERRRRQGEVLTRVLPRIRDIRRLGSCALDICAVASGLLDAYVEEGAHIWDHAAAGLICAEAGGVVEVTRSPGDKRLLICAPADGFAEFREVVVDTGFVRGEGPHATTDDR